MQQPYSHASLIFVHDGNAYHAEAAINGIDEYCMYLEKFIDHYADRVDIYELMPIELTGERIRDNIAYMVYEAEQKPTSYAALYRALINFERDDTAVCTGFVLDCLGIQSKRYHTVVESILIASHFYYLLNIYGN